MELANGKKNKFFTLQNEGENRYYIEDFDAEKTKGLNNVYLLCKEIEKNKNVLDIGCGQGRFGKILKEKGCTVYGIELDPIAADCAMNTGCYEKVFVMDISDESSIKYKEFKENIELVDVIILSDILEHLVNPTKLLRTCSKFLKNNGVIMISVPNIAHMDILLNLMNDKFNYQDMGILDNTHLKFFTKTSFIDWIEQINNFLDEVKFDCEYLGSTFYNNDFINKIRTEYEELFEILENCNNHNGFQLLFKLTKISKETLPIELEKLQKIKNEDVVKLFGNALKGKANFTGNHKLVKGERLWYEQQLKDLKNYIKSESNKKNKYINALEESVDWYKQNSENQIESKNKYIEELEKSVDWYKQNNENQIKNKDKYIEELEKSLQWYKEKNIEDEEKNNKIQKKYKEELLELRQKLFEIENSLICRLIKFFKKK